MSERRGTNNNNNTNRIDKHSYIDYNLLLKSAEIPYDYTIHASNKLTHPFTGTGIVLCIPLDAEMYPKGASKFCEFITKGRRGIMPIWALQNWLFTLHITYLRFAASNTRQGSNLPFNIFVETLRSETKEFVENRIWIFQQSEVTADINILKIYNEIKTSATKQFTGKGDLNAMATSTVKHKARTASISVDSLFLATTSAVCLKIHEAMCKGSLAAEDPASPVKVFHPVTQFDKSQCPNPNICVLQRTIGTYITSITPDTDICTFKLDPTLPNMEIYKIHPTDMLPKNFMKKMFPHISVNIEEIDYINSLRKLIAKKQLNEANFAVDLQSTRSRSRNGGSRHEQQERNRNQIFSDGISDMKRMHQHNRTNISEAERDEMDFFGKEDRGDDDYINNADVDVSNNRNDRNDNNSYQGGTSNRATASSLKRSIVVNRLYGAQKKMKSWDELDEEDEERKHVTNDAAHYDSMAKMSRERMADNDMNYSEGDRDSDKDQDDSERRDMEDIEAQAIMRSAEEAFANPISDDMIDTNCGDITKLNIFGDYDQYDDFGALSMLKRRVINLDKVICALFSDEPEQLKQHKRIIESFNIEFYVTHCHSSQSNIAEKKQAIMGHWTANNLESLRPRFKILDPTYDHIISQVAIELISDFGHFESIAFHQVTLFILWVGCMDRFRIELNQHFNALLTGNGGTGKSVLVDKLRANLPPKAIEDIDSRSTCFTAVNSTTISRIQSSDELDISKITNISEAKTLMSRGYVNRVSLNLDGNDSGRTLDNFTYISIGCNIDMTNFTRSDMIQKVGISNMGSVEALLTRYLQIQVNQYNDPVRPLRDTMVAEQVINNSLGAAAFRKRNIWLQCVVSDYWDLVYAKMLAPPNMECFDILMSKYENSLRSHGIPDLNNRTPNLIKLWCQSLVVLSGVIDLFCMPNSLHADRDYEPRLILDIMPICHQQHAVLAFTLFYHAFFPSEFNIVVDLLNSVISDASLTSQKTVEFKDPKQERSADETKAAQKAYIAAEKEKKRSSNVDKFGKKAPLKAVPRVDEFDNESTGAGVGGGNKPRTQWDQVRDVTGGSNPNGNHGGEGSNSAKQPINLAGHQSVQNYQRQIVPQTEASGFYYVCFNECSVRNLAYKLYNEANNPKSTDKNIYITMIPSIPAIASVLEFFSRVKVNSTYFVNRNNSIVPDSEAEKVPMLGVILHGANIYVNYTLLRDDKTFKQLWKIALESSMNCNTLKQKMLVGIPHENYPFYLQSIMFDKNRRPAIIKNPHFISPMTQYISYGTTDNTQLQECHRQEYLSPKHDIDMSCITQAAKKNPNYIERLDLSGIDMPVKELYLYLTSPSIRFYDMWTTGGADRKAIRYPEDCVRLNNQQRLRSLDALDDILVDEVSPAGNDDSQSNPDNLDNIAKMADEWVRQTAEDKNALVSNPNIYVFGNAPDPEPERERDKTPDNINEDARDGAADNFPHFDDDEFIPMDNLSDF
jgi:hypothetical protein